MHNNFANYSYPTHTDHSYQHRDQKRLQVYADQSEELASQHMGCNPVEVAGIQADYQQELGIHRLGLDMRLHVDDRDQIVGLVGRRRNQGLTKDSSLPF